MKEQGDFTAVQSELINWPVFTLMRETLGMHFIRLLGYLRDDGTKSVSAIEAALHSADSSRIVIPAHTLKSEAAQFGADQLSMLAEEIEIASRHYVEIQRDPSDLTDKITALRPLLENSLSALEDGKSLLVHRLPLHPLPFPARERTP